MRVLAILHTSPPVHGAAIVGDNVLNILNSNYDDLHVIKIQSSSAINEIGKLQFHKIFSFFLLIFKVIFSCSKCKPNVVYFTGSIFGLALIRDVIVVSVVKMFGVKNIFIHLHTIGVKLNEESSLVYKFLYFMLFNNTSIICLSEYGKSDVSSYSKYINKYYILNNACFTSNSTDNLPSKSSSKIKFLYLSNLMESKGYKYVLDLCEKLKSASSLNMECEFIFAGSWGSVADEDYFHRFIEKNNLGDFVKYNGVVYGVDKEYLLSSSHFLIFPTYYKKESFPLVVVEALCYGLLVISTEHASIPEILSDTSSLIIKKNELIPVNQVVNFVNAYSDAQKFDLDMKKSIKKYKEFYTKSVFESKLLSILNDGWS